MNNNLTSRRLQSRLASHRGSPAIDRALPGGGSSPSSPSPSSKQRRSKPSRPCGYRLGGLGAMATACALSAVMILNAAQFGKLGSRPTLVDHSHSSSDPDNDVIPAAGGTGARLNNGRLSRSGAPTASHRKLDDAPQTSDTVAAATRGGRSPYQRDNLLDSPRSLKELPPCQAARVDLLRPPAAEEDGARAAGGKDATLFDPSRPTIFANWDPPATRRWSSRDAFASEFGSHPQYVKGRDVQPLRDAAGEACRASTRTIVDAMVRRSAGMGGAAAERATTGTAAATRGGASAAADARRSEDLLFFTNDEENPSFLSALSADYDVPPPIADVPPFDDDGGSNSFRVFSAMEQGSSHPFHFHDAAWLGQVAGSRLWYFLPPDTPRSAVGGKVNGCEYLAGRAPLPAGTTSCVQREGEVVYFPSGWYHATCALEPWSVGVGGQGGSPSSYEQKFDNLEVVQTAQDASDERKKMVECGALTQADYESSPSVAGSDSSKVAMEQQSKQQPNQPKIDSENSEWTFYDGDLNEYYNKLERDEHAKRNPNEITSYAVHRWMGPEYSTLIHYELVRSAIYENVLGRLPPSSTSLPGGEKLRVFDAGCGLGPGLMWFEQHEPSWDLVGHTISEVQHKWISEDLPPHRFKAKLRTYDEPLDDGNEAPFNAVYSIEAAVHSPDLRTSIEAWSRALLPGGVIVIIDDFLAVGVPRDDPDVDLFARSWIANAVHTTTEIATWADQMGMTFVRDRDLGSEYQIVKRNYKNKAPKLRDEQGRVHQGWLGSKVRQKLMVEGKISYRLVVLQKKGTAAAASHEETCASVPAQSSDNLSITVEPVLMSGRGGKGGRKLACISSWYCCDQGTTLWDEMEASRTEKTAFLQLKRDLFGHYLTSFSKHLTDFYQTYPASYGTNGDKQGIFLDIGGTGSVASGMQQVTSKFTHFAGPLKYWVLDSDPDAKKLTNAVVCDIDDCPEAPDCGYDVTFSHTVLEHAARPWKSFDTIARITKRGGLTLHLVPWSYQYHATPDDNYRFSHTALATLLEDRGFEVLDVGYDICTQPEKMLKTRRDEHFEKIWLTYVVGRKL